MEQKTIENYKEQRLNSIKETLSGRPLKTSNKFFGVGPITDMAENEVDARLMWRDYENWLEENYIKYDDKGNPIGNFTLAEFKRSMHRGYPADKVLVDMMREIHGYFDFPKKNKMAVGIGGGHSGFTVAALHLMRSGDPEQRVFVDTPRPESGDSGGFFRQSWAAQLIEMQQYSKNGNPDLIHFSEKEGAIPEAETLSRMGIKLFFGVGHETTGATTYTEKELKNLIEWIQLNPVEHHAVIDATSLLGSMVWGNDLNERILSDCCMFMPFQKAIGGVSGYFVVSLTPHALEAIEKNVEKKSWAIPRQLKLAVPIDGGKPLTGKSSIFQGPVYDPEKDAMLGGIINTYSILAFTETTFGVLWNKERIGSVKKLNERSIKNRGFVEQWLSAHPLFKHGVENPESRGAAVTLLKVNDPGITDTAIHNRIIAKSKQLLGYEGITHPNGEYEEGLDTARYVNAFPGTPGDYRAWVGGIRPVEDVEALLDNLNYAYHRAKVVVLEEELAKEKIHFDKKQTTDGYERKDDPDKAYKVLIADLIGMEFDSSGKPDCGEVKKHIEEMGGVFHSGLPENSVNLSPGIHFFYEPDLSRPEDFSNLCSGGQYDALIAAASFIPQDAKFECGGVRIGAGTGNMNSGDWGGANGTGGTAPLMNTPGFNSRAMAQAVMKALLKVKPNIAVEKMHKLVVEGRFDTGKNLKEYPSRKPEGQTMAVLGYGNTGREVAKLGQSFGMKVKIFAREKHKAAIESEGFQFSPSVRDAAQNADVITSHLGLGSMLQTGQFANSGLINAEIFQALNQGAVLINYDRGEIVDAKALDEALTSGQISHAAIDADIFIEDNGTLKGPMLPYLDVYKNHPGKMELLPHAAADTDHVSRVEGAKQAVNQIFDAIRYKLVVNLKGDLPQGYTNGGTKSVKGVTKVQQSLFSDLDSDALREFRKLTEEISAFWGGLEAMKESGIREELIRRYSADVTLKMNRLKSTLEKNGLFGPFQQD